jgi:hypothetical protein
MSCEHTHPQPIEISAGESRPKDGAERFELQHSTVAVEPSPVGPVGRVEPEDGAAEYAVIAEETVDALAEVAGVAEVGGAR